MPSKVVWLTLILLTAGASLFFTLSAGKDIYSYLRLHEKTPAVTILWSLEKQGSNRFALHAEYTYDAEGKRHQGVDTPYVYRNPYVALEALMHCREKGWTVWYGRGKSAIVRTFPYKSTVYAALSASLSLYFFFLSLYHTRKQRDYLCTAK